jgi:ornithine cyclodeaminase/alanine dehydrogenase-like protein (mu-crystallin family)
MAFQDVIAAAMVYERAKERRFERILDLAS